MSLPAAAEAVDATVRERLALLSPIRLELIDDSARHAGHAGARGGGGHYRLLIVAAVFAGQTRLARHRLINQLLGDLIPARMHALSIKAMTPEEVASPASVAI
ncbi:MAG: BolA family transcriptional regulator [Candidatus Accumulibacter phosphatis]|uniref:BolA family protein n=1 Tax=Candidatus Accumulibacter phosphatis TaxID=327160 RepID=UPI001A5AA192|nr:BolA family transcriptional regulator [Candidatus Accumulibacter phosphatis]